MKGETPHAAADEVKTAAWVETTTRHLLSPAFEHTMRWWVRLDPPAEAWRSDLESHDVIDERGHFHTAPSWDNCSLSPAVQPLTRDGLLRKVLAPDLAGQPAAGKLSVPGGTWRTESTQLNGRPTKLYIAEYPAETYRVEQRVWFDPVTRHILRKERSERDPRTGDLVVGVVSDQYRYNQEIPPGTFDLPGNKPLVGTDLEHRFPTVTDTLPGPERAAIEAVIRQSDAGWAVGDFAPFAASWTFERLEPRDPRPTEDDWRGRVEVQAGNWRHWESRVVEITQTGFFGVAMSSSSYRLVEAEGTLSVKVTLRVEWEGGTWDGNAMFDIVPRPQGYRILHWECPFEEIAAARDAVGGALS